MYICVCIRCVLHLNTTHTVMCIICVMHLNTTHTVMCIICVIHLNTTHTVMCIIYVIYLNTTHTVMCIICVLHLNTTLTVMCIIHVLHLNTTHTIMCIIHVLHMWHIRKCRLRILIRFPNTIYVQTRHATIILIHKSTISYQINRQAYVHEYWHGCHDRLHVVFVRILQQTAKHYSNKLLNITTNRYTYRDS